MDPRSKRNAAIMVAALCLICATAGDNRALFAAGGEPTASRRGSFPDTSAISRHTLFEEPKPFQRIFSSIRGGPVTPASALADPYGEYNGIAIDPKDGLALLCDDNLKSILAYDLNVDAPPGSQAVTPYKARVTGPDTSIVFCAGIAIDTARNEFYTAENDIEDKVSAFPLSANGNLRGRDIATPHGAYGVGISQRYRQMAVTIQAAAEVLFFRLQASGAEAPQRALRGLRTGLADPHGLVWDEQNKEIYVSNYGNWSRAGVDADYTGGGRYYPPSIAVFAENARDDAKPIRVIQGSQTEMNWPTGLAVDTAHNELFVANEAGGQVLVFARTAKGNVAPIRVLAGPNTLISHPMGVAYDPSHDQLWVANFGHTTEIFDRAAQGDAAPKRVVRNAPEGTPACGFGNPMAVAYDSKRDQLLVPN